MIYALFDTKDKVWMGDEAGPVTYKDPQLARLCAEVLSDQLKWPVTRIRAIPYDNSATKIRDRVDFQRTTAEALERLESGLV
jgi:hypothetical protein